MIHNLNKVAILMSTYNGEKYVASQILSIQAQTYSDWSLYIRDDCSTDSTYLILEQFVKQYKNIYIIKDGERLGPKLSFMRLLENIDSMYYMFSDQDDYWLENKIQVFVDAMDKCSCRNKPMIVCSDLKVVDEDLNLISPSFWKFSGFKIKDFNDLCFHWYWNDINGCSMMINQEVKRVSLPIPKESSMHDSWLTLSTLAHGGKVITIESATMLYRQHVYNVVGAKRDKMSHYITDLCGVVSRTHNQYLTIRYLTRISFASFLLKKIWLRLGQII